VAITFDRIVKLSTAKKILILAALMVLIWGLYFYMIYLPKSEVLNKRNAELTKLETQLQQLKIVALDVKRFQSEAAKLREELQLAITQLPTSKEIPSLLASVSNLGKESRLEFLLFRPTPEVNREFYAEIPVEIRVRGIFNDVALFFDKVGKLPRIVNINGVSMDSAKEVHGRWEIVTSCTATTFKFIEKDATELAKENKENKDKKDVKKGNPPEKK
jgi:type IV pilus assembly protein PilO